MIDLEVQSDLLHLLIHCDACDACDALLTRQRLAGAVQPDGEAVLKVARALGVRLHAQPA